MKGVEQRTPTVALSITATRESAELIVELLNRYGFMSGTITPAIKRGARSVLPACQLGVDQRWCFIYCPFKSGHLRMTHYPALQFLLEAVGFPYDAVVFICVFQCSQLKNLRPFLTR
jgi:hypothetical protein